MHCHLCVGTWAGTVLAAIYRPNLLADVDSKPTSASRKVAKLAGDAMLIALGTRLWNEILGLLRREVQVKQKEIDTPRIQRVDEPASVEIEPAMLPGISIRS